ncbi:uncharacterized protein LOC132933006 [Metopolophium dirhodum]|uniref:uncharacterized protein LOC132933006 n=1 Tax=Metopolophium dirhodum TaxID=44670 RepID=UPI00298FEF30|nr:uncharacterized protein LOC132933006 [Metopolophium dirhodum]
MPFFFAPAPLGGGLILRIKTVRRFRHFSLHSAAEIKKRNRELAMLYLATSGTFVALSLYFARGESTVRKIIKETTEIIWNVLKDIHMPVPTQDQFKHIADRFELLWNLPNCIGALDGKHIRIEKFPHTGSENFNYKHFHSTVLMACCDADGLFTVIEPGFAGRNSDGGIFKACAMNYWITHGGFNILSPSPLRHDKRNTPFPYYFVGDEAFPLFVKHTICK